MKVTVDLRVVGLGVVCAAFGFGVHALAAPPPPPTVTPQPPPAEAAFPATQPVPGVTRWDFRCVGHDTVGVTQNWANEDLDKANGWNPYLAKQTSAGWEPAVFIAPQGVIVAVCFRRPAEAKKAAAPAGPPVQGRCTAADLAQMHSAAMSESAIKAACSAP